MLQIINGYLGNVLLVLGIFLFSKIIFKTKLKVSKNRFVIDFIVSTIIYTIILFKFTGTIKTLFMGLTMMAFCKDIFKETYKKTIFFTILYMIMLGITDLIELLFLIKVMNLSKEFCYNEFAGSFIGNLTIFFTYLILLFLLKTALRKLEKEKIETNTKIIIFAILILICIGMFFYRIIREYRFSDDIYIYLGTIAVLLIVLFSLIKQTINNNRLTREYDNLLKFMTTYENEIEKQRILRHEIKNEFKTIRAKICDNLDNKEIIEYIDEIVKDKYKVNQEKYAKFGYLPQNGIKGLCYYKVQEAEAQGIDVALNISKRIQTSAIYDLNIKQQRDFGRILGVFLDNAIEASLESKQKQLGIEAYTNSDHEFKLIITNTYNNNIDKNKIGKESFSTKGSNRGHGLLLVQQLVQKHSIFELKTEIRDNLYSQMIIIKKE